MVGGIELGARSNLYYPVKNYYLCYNIISKKLNSPEVRSFINEHRNLFWYIPEDKKEEVSHELLVETIFNYGNLNDIRQLVSILGIKRLTDIYNGIKGRKKLNYYPEIFNLFSLMISKYAH